MRLLVTGAGGLIGRAVVCAATTAGIETVAVGRRMLTGLPECAHSLAVDLADSTAAAAIVRKFAPTHIVHAAWETSQPTYWHDTTNLAWLHATAAMAHTFAEVGGERFVLVGSCAEYAWQGAPPLRDGPATLYGKAKLAAFRAIEAIAHNRYAAVEARIFWVYGPGENEQRYIPLLCRSYATGKTPDLGSGQKVRDLLYVDDCARALIRLLARQAPVGVVDIGTGQGTKLADVAAQLAALAGASETGLNRMPDRDGDPAALIADPEALKATGWLPQVTLHEGLARTYASWQAAQRD